MEETLIGRKKSVGMKINVGDKMRKMLRWVKFRDEDEMASSIE
jgi:hypothetical protein